MSIRRVFVSLLAHFVRGKVVALAVCDSGALVCMGRKVVKFRNSFVRALGHRVLLLCSMRADPWRFFRAISAKPIE